MNLNILWALLIYYTLISLFWVAAYSDNLVTDPSSNDFSSRMNVSTISEAEATTAIGTVTSVIATIGRFLGFVFLGVGLPGDTPAFISVTFSLWQIMLLLFTSGFIYQAIRGG